MSDFENIQNRLSNLRVSYEVKKRENDKALEEAETLLSTIKEDDLSLLKPDIPEIDMLKNLTVESLVENKHKEQEMLKLLIQKMTELIEERLTYYEGLI